MTSDPGAREALKGRVILDTVIILWMLGLAFYAGLLTQQVSDLREAINTRGRVQISVEAAERLNTLESEQERQDMRLQELEDEVRRLSYQFQ